MKARAETANRLSAGEKFEELVRIIRTLRGEDGCPWDRVQDERSIADYLLEEAYEAAEAVLSGSRRAAAEELGDVLMEVVFLALLFEEKKGFGIDDVLDRISDKLVRRHPHVFGGRRLRRAGEVVDAWQKTKLAEKSRQSVLDGLARTTPGLLAAFQMGGRVSAVGFDWGEPRAALEKVREEIAELDEALAAGGGRAAGEEVGDLLFALANVARLLGVNPELVLRQANAKFARRFRRLEAALQAKGKTPSESNLAEMDGLWNVIKKKERRRNINPRRTRAREGGRRPG